MSCHVVIQANAQSVIIDHLKIICSHLNFSFATKCMMLFCTDVNFTLTNHMHNNPECLQITHKFTSKVHDAAVEGFFAFCAKLMLH